MAIDYLVLDVFTIRPLAGNPLAVVPDAAGLEGPLMQQIARELNLSETAFVTAGSAPDRLRLRMFTPTRELPFAGHPTIGTALGLAALGRIGSTVIFEEDVGPVPVTLAGGRATLESPRLPAPVEAAGAADAAAVLGLPRSRVMEVAGWSAGVPFACVRVGAAADLAAVRFDHAAWRRAMADGPAPSVYAYAVIDAQTVRARMFAPAMGVAEDPATGAAATALAGALGPGRFVLHQGVEMGRPSVIHLEVGDTVRVGGDAVQVAEGRLLL